MYRIEVARKDWPRTLDAFSAAHEGWLISLDLLGPAVGLGLHQEIRELPLRGVTAEIGGREPSITIAAARTDGEHITHLVRSPTRLRIDRTEDGDDVALRIESAEGTSAILRFKTAGSVDADRPREMRA
jgi:hypothetical protein